MCGLVFEPLQATTTLACKLACNNLRKMQPFEAMRSTCVEYKSNGPWNMFSPVTAEWNHRVRCDHKPKGSPMTKREKKTEGQVHGSQHVSAFLVRQNLLVHPQASFDPADADFIGVRRRNLDGFLIPKFAQGSAIKSLPQRSLFPKLVLHDLLDLLHGGPSLTLRAVLLWQKGFQKHLCFQWLWMWAARNIVSLYLCLPAHKL